MRWRWSAVVLVMLLMSLAVGGMASAQAAVDAPACGGTVTTGTINGTMESGGLTRQYLVYVPESYDPAQPAPLVMSLHGFASNAAQQGLWSQWNRIADAEGFIVVYPQGTGSPARWNAGQSAIANPDRAAGGGALRNFLGQFFEEVRVDDVAFIHALIARLQTDFCIDPARIYVNGLSNGGGMTNRIACELSDEIAAVGTVAGAYTEFPGGCHPSRPVPVIAFHGATDPIVPYGGSEQINFPAIPAWAAGWAARDQCDLTPEPVAGTVGDVSGVRYTGCAGDAEVVLYTISDGGHTWPGGFPIPAFLAGKTTQDIDASATMWDFFQAHPLE